MSEIETLLIDFDSLYFGIGFEKINKEAAIAKLLRASELGSRFAQACCLLNGHGVSKNEAAAVKLLRELAYEGDARARSMLLECYLEQCSGIFDSDGGISEYTYAHGQYCHAARFYWGHDIAQDYTEAVKWYNKAAMQGHVLAQDKLAWCYYRGQGVQQDYTEATKWFRMAYLSVPNSYGPNFVHCLHTTAKALLDNGDNIDAAELLWEAIGAREANVSQFWLNDISHDFWTKTLPPLRLIAARAVFLAGESAGLDIYHEGIRDEAELVRESLKWAGLPHGPT